MKVILLSDLMHGGRRGEILDVKPGYARNYLFPKGLAARATQANQKWFEEQREKIEAKLAHERGEAAELATKIDGTRVEIVKRAAENETLYGSVTPVEVVMALEKQGIEVDRKAVDLGGGIKALGEHQVRIELHPDVAAEIIVHVVPETA
jgi:large subunit ribosomal protein L9